MSWVTGCRCSRCRAELRWDYARVAMIVTTTLLAIVAGSYAASWLLEIVR